ncbi:MAG: FtsQ-type POTRA domain-containing protein [Mollicutes bacterium]|nr:FtsQ-type POTRA domain-containing protein [Mollicutes bacterium]
MNKKRRKKRKFRFKALFTLLLIIYIFTALILYLFKMPIKSITIKGNNLLTENDIIMASKIDSKSSFIKTTGYSIKKKIKSLDLIDTVKISKKLFGKVIIDVTEYRILFFNNNTNKTVLSSGKEIKGLEQYVGYPILINDVPKESYKNLIKGLCDVDDDVLKMISEIEYSPNIYNELVVDDERFILKTNDGNKIVINNVNMYKLNKYKQIYFGLSEKGILYLDSTDDNFIFEKYN